MNLNNEKKVILFIWRNPNNYFSFNSNKKINKHLVKEFYYSSVKYLFLSINQLGQKNVIIKLRGIGKVAKIFRDDLRGRV